MMKGRTELYMFEVNTGTGDRYSEQIIISHQCLIQDVTDAESFL